MNRKLLIGLGAVVVLVIAAILLGPRAWRAYAVAQIESAKRDGVYGSAEEGMRALIQSNYRDIERVVIDHAGTNSFDGGDPHVWFVSARVYAAARADGHPIAADDYDYPGSYFLHIDEGWVHVPEGAFPEVIGDAMVEFGLYGCDQAAGNCG